MEHEMLKVFDGQRQHIGEAARVEVHNKGLWHETFHCWVISTSTSNPRIYLQLRSDRKKDFPNLFDITAAGHILMNETMEDGVREIKEEIGLSLDYKDLQFLGVVKNCIVTEGFIDKEHSYIFSYEFDGAVEDFKLQPEEVSGIVEADLDEFINMLLGNHDTLKVEGYSINSLGKKSALKKEIGLKDFVPHEKQYFIEVAHLISQTIA